MADITISSLPPGILLGSGVIPVSQGNQTIAVAASSVKLLNTDLKQPWQVAGDQISVFSNTNIKADLGVYDLYVKANPNACGSGQYRDFYYGKIYIGVGYKTPENIVVKYIGWQQISTPPRTFSDSGGGNLVLSALMYNPSTGTEFTHINYNSVESSNAFIKIRISGFTWNNTTCLPPYAAANSNTEIILRKEIGI